MAVLSITKSKIILKLSLNPPFFTPQVLLALLSKYVQNPVVISYICTATTLFQALIISDISIFAGFFFVPLIFSSEYLVQQLGWSYQNRSYNKPLSQGFHFTQSKSHSPSDSLPDLTWFVISAYFLVQSISSSPFYHTNFPVFP